MSVGEWVMLVSCIVISMCCTYWEHSYLAEHERYMRLSNSYASVLDMLNERSGCAAYLPHTNLGDYHGAGTTRFRDGADQHKHRGTVHTR